MLKIPRNFHVVVSSTLFLLLITSCLAQPGWFRGGPGGGPVSSLAASPNQAGVLYAGSHAGIFKTTDAGEHWSLASPTVAHFEARQIAVSRGTPERILALMQGSLAYSPDAGATWTHLHAPGQGIVDIECDSAGRLFLATMQGLYRSDDAGAHWTLVQPADLGIVSVALAPGTPTVVYAGSQDSLFWSTDYGDSWFAKPLGGYFESNDILVDPFASSVIFLAGGGQVRKTTDAGETWSDALPGVDEPVDSLVADFSTPGVIYAFDRYSENAFRTTDGGGSWHEVLVSRNHLQGVASDSGSPGSIFLGFGSGGVLRSLDEGEHWTDASAGIPALESYDVVVDANNGAVAYARVNGVQKTTDAGVNWTPLTLPVPRFSEIATHPRLSDRLYAVRDNFFYVSTDGGTTWATREVQPEGATISLFGVTQSGIYVSWEGAALKKSVDEGLSWTDCGVSNPGQVVEAPSDPRILYCTTLSGALYKSSDSGATWQLVETNTRLYRLAVDHKNRLLLLGIGVDESSSRTAAFFRSTDGGSTWRKTRPAPTKIQQQPAAVAFDPILPNVAYAGLNEAWPPIPMPVVTDGLPGGLWRSVDGGISWNPIEPEWPFAAQVGGIAFSTRDPSHMYVGSYEGVFAIETGFAAERDLGLSRAHAENLWAEEEGEYSILVTNVGRRSTTGTMVVTETLPTGAELVKASGAFWQCGYQDGRVRCSRSYVMPSGSTSKITVRVRVSGAAVPAAMPSASVSLAGDWNPYNNEAGDLIPVNNLFYFPHIANGALGSLTLDTSFFFLNAGDDCDFEAQFLDSNAAPLYLPLDGVGGVSFAMSLATWESVQVQTSGVGNPLAGYAQVKGGPGFTGSAVLSYSSGGKPLSEAAVLPVYPAKQSRLFLDGAGGTRTALAVANRGETSAVFSLKVLDSAGALAAQRSSLDAFGALGPGAYRAFYLSQFFPNVALPALGIVEIEAQEPLAIMSLREAGPASAPEISLLPAFSGSVSAAAEPLDRVFPYLVSGRWGDWTFRTRLLLSNSAAGEQEAHVTFHDRNGDPMEVELEGLGVRSNHDLAMGPGATVALQTTGAESLFTGYARVVGSPGIVALTLLEVFPAQGTALRQTVIPMGDDLTAFTLQIDSREGFETGLAIVNRATVASLVQVSLRNRQGNRFAFAAFRLPPGKMVADYISNLFNHVPKNDLRHANVEVTAEEPVSALALRQAPPGPLGEPGLLALFPVFRNVSW